MTDVTPDITLASGRTFTHHRVAEDAQEVMDQDRNSEMSDAEWLEYCELLAKAGVAQKAERHAASKVAYAARSKPTMVQRLYDAVDEIEADVKAANTDRTIEEIAHCLGIWNVATWQGWTIIRIPGATPRSVCIEATAENGDVVLKEFPARTGYKLPFDRMDVEKALVPFGAVLAR